VLDVRPRGVYDLAQGTTQNLMKVREMNKASTDVGDHGKLEAEKDNFESIRRGCWSLCLTII
jgi:hypothetical protein